MGEQVINLWRDCDSDPCPREHAPWIVSLDDADDSGGSQTLAVVPAPRNGRRAYRRALAIAHREARSRNLDMNEERS